jgi:IclR family pca regulon transcriptional regulator
MDKDRERRPAKPPRGSDAESGTDVKPAYRVEALAKGLRLLTLFTEQHPVWRVSDLAPAANMPLPSVYRIVVTLTEEGFLERLPSGDYRPGVRVLTLGTAALHSFDLVEVATPLLQRLADETKETVNLCVLTGDRVLYLVRLRNADLVTANIQVGSTLPAVHTSIGKLLLAHLDRAQLAEQITASSFPASHGPNARSSLAELRPDLDKIRRSGWSVQDEEVAHGLRSIAAPVRDAEGTVVAGANIAVQSGDWSKSRLLQELKPRILQTCEEISALLGHRGGNE